MNYDEYKVYVNEREGHLAPCATKSLDTVLFDGTNIRERYSKIFNIEEKLFTDRYKFRTPFQLDRDRILASPMFIRLSQKTQLLTSRKGLIENRFTHTMRVVQIAKSICYGLKLNQDLAEAIAYGHDVGHTPFAHIGERTLNDWLKDVIPKSSGQASLLKNEKPPVLAKIEASKQNLFGQYFTFGNDPEEDFFMHGRQSFRLLIFRKPPVCPGESNYSNYTRPVLFGIWRHSYEKNTKTDATFKYVVDLKEEIKGKISFEDLTLETHAARIADDIAWAVMDLFKGLKEKLVNVSDIRKAMDGLSPGENHIPLSRSEIISNFENGNLSPIYTYFISDVINTNKERVNEERDHNCILEFSESVRSDLRALMALVRERIHKPSPVARAAEMHKSMIKSLCDWYYNHPHDLVNEIKSLRYKKDFPFDEVS